MTYDIIFYRGKRRVGHIRNVESILHGSELSRCMVVTTDGKLYSPGFGVPVGADRFRLVNVFEESDIGGGE